MRVRGCPQILFPSGPAPPIRASSVKQAIPHRIRLRRRREARPRRRRGRPGSRPARVIRATGERNPLSSGRISVCSIRTPASASVTLRMEPATRSWPGNGPLIKGLPPGPGSIATPPRSPPTAGRLLDLQQSPAVGHRKHAESPERPLHVSQSGIWQHAHGNGANSAVRRLGPDGQQQHQHDHLEQPGNAKRRQRDGRLLRSP